MSCNKTEKIVTDGGAGGDEAAVEELLRAAQDDVLLKLRLNSHSVSEDSHFVPLDPDLTRRFDALKSKPSVPSSSNRDFDLDDLESRFAKLKGGVGSGSDRGVESMGSGGGSGVGMEDEVEKLMQWALDAARLDPSSENGTGEDEDETGEIDSNKSSEDESGDEEDEDGKANRKKPKVKVKVKAKAEKKRWFF